MDNYLTKLGKIEILLTNIRHGQNFDKHWTETGQNLDICQKIVQILSNPPFYRSTEKLHEAIQHFILTLINPQESFFEEVRATRSNAKRLIGRTLLPTHVRVLCKLCWFFYI